MQDTIIRNIIVMLTLAVVAFGAAIWVPNHARSAPSATLTKGFPQSYTSHFNSLHKQSTPARVVVSYNNPAVRRTLDLPWVR